MDYTQFVKFYRGIASFSFPALSWLQNFSPNYLQLQPTNVYRTFSYPFDIQYSTLVLGPSCSNLCDFRLDTPL
jgi:hypothetical protein